MSRVVGGLARSRGRVATGGIARAWSGRSSVRLRPSSVWYKNGKIPKEIHDSSILVV
jgi:hypothetical protein